MPIMYHDHPKIIKLTFNHTHPNIFSYQLLISGINMQKSILFHYFILEIYLIKKSSILIGCKTVLPQYNWERNP